MANRTYIDPSCFEHNCLDRGCQYPFFGMYTITTSGVKSTPKKKNLIKISFKKGDEETGIEIPKNIVEKITSTGIYTIFEVAMKKLGITRKK